MLGLIKKDILMVKNNFKLILLALVVYVFLGLTNGIDMSFIIPFMVVMIFISTFNYDDYNNWNAYAITLPNGRDNVVKSKYIATIILTLLAVLISILFSIIVSAFKGDIDIKGIISSMSGGLMVMIFIVSILYPLLFKYGSEKGRIGLFIVSFALLGFVGFSSEFITFDIPVVLIDFFKKYKIIIFIVVSCLMLTISYSVSKKVYSKRSF